MSIKLLHLADIHYSRERKDDVLMALRAVKDNAKKNAADMIAIAGDIFDSAMLNSANTGFPELLDAIKELADAAPVCLVYGTPSHDVDSCLDVFPKLTAKHGITILEPGQAYFLKGGRLDTEPAINADALFFGIPEPRRKFLLADSAGGKDETEEAVRDAMHRMCFLLAAKRMEYPDIPCALLYHGDVAGSTLQNDQTVERGTGISITIDDLADIGADYACLGHIHKPQQIGVLPAYYAGSLIPKNFGETHKAGFNLVTVDKGKAEVNRIDIDYPQNLKIETAGPVKYELPMGGIAGKRVWLEITCTKEERATVSIEDNLAQLRKLGAVEGSRVTISDIPVETVRAAEIAEAATPEKKFEIWARNSDMEIRDGMTRKITALAKDISHGAAKAAGEWELVSLRLRGATGIKKGIHRDEIFINFDKYENGLIALTGANGKGKTTLIENCHPYPQLLTRKGTLREHSFLRDSFREAVYRNRANGAMLKFLIQIDGQNKSGSCKYFVFTQTAGLTDEDWQPVDGVDGNLKPYAEELLRLFGPAELFQRTAFISQRPTKDLPDLTDATAGEKKALFVALAGIDYLQGFADAAAEKSKQEAGAIHDAEIRLQMLADAVSRKDTESKTLAESEGRLKACRKNLDEITGQGKTAKADMEQRQEAWNAEQERARKENEARLAAETAAAEITRLDNEARGYQTAAENKAAYETKIADYETLQKRVEAENAKKQKTTEGNLKKAQEFAELKSAYDAKAKAVQTEYVDLCNKRNDTERLILGAKASIKLYERDAADIKDACPTCGQKLPESKIAELAARRNEFVKKISEEEAGIAKHAALVEETAKRIEELAKQSAELSFEEPEMDPPDTFDGTVLQAAMEDLRRIDIAEARKSLARAQEAAVRIEGLRKQIADGKNRLAELEARHKELLPADGHDGRKIRDELDAAVKRHADLTEQYTAVKTEIARTEENIKAAQRALAEIEAQEKEMKTISEGVAQSKREAAEWDIIAKAFGRDGIQALELDALAPGISETANRILRSAYGDRFNISIETTRIGGTGKKTKQIEDFLIYVTDSADGDGEATLLENKSGGEAVWIKRAIYDAFAVIRKRNTAFAFLTCFQDETDGALDSESKTAYCRMLEASHAESGLRHTVIITHSNEVKAMIEQKIDMAELASKE